MSVLAGRYARALFEVAEARGATDAVAEQLAELAEPLANPGVQRALSDPEVALAERTRILERLVEGRHELVQNLVRALAARRRHALLAELPRAFDTLRRRARGELDGVVEAPAPLGDEQMQHLTELANRLTGARVHLTFEERPELIGGVRLRIGNTLYDGSVATALAELQERLLAVQVA